jgi:hypothetical protein
MKKPKSNSKVTATSDEVLEILGKELLEDLKAKDPNTLEIFERYSHGLRLKVHVKEQEFLQHFIQGYHTLLEELSQQAK